MFRENSAVRGIAVPITFSGADLITAGSAGVCILVILKTFDLINKMVMKPNIPASAIQLVRLFIVACFFAIAVSAVVEMIKFTSSLTAQVAALKAQVAAQIDVLKNVAYSKEVYYGIIAAGPGPYNNLLQADINQLKCATDQLRIAVGQPPREGQACAAH